MLIKNIYLYYAIITIALTISFKLACMQTNLHYTKNSSTISPAVQDAPSQKNKRADEDNALQEQNSEPTKKQSFYDNDIVELLLLQDEKGVSALDRAALELDQDLLPFIVRHFGALLFERNQRGEIPFDYIFSSFIFNYIPDHSTATFLSKLISLVNKKNETLLHEAIRAGNTHAVQQLVDFILDHPHIHGVLLHRNDHNQTPYEFALETEDSLSSLILNSLEAATVYLTGTSEEISTFRNNSSSDNPKTPGDESEDKELEKQSYALLNQVAAHIAFTEPLLHLHLYSKT